MASESNNRAVFWSGLALGLAVAASVGVIGLIIFVIRRSTPQPQALFGMPMMQPMVPPAYATVPMRLEGDQSIPGETEVDLITAFRPQTTANTKTLPSLSVPGSAAIRVAGSDQAPVEVSVRTSGPPGSFATLAFSASELNTPGLAAVIPTGFSFTIPVGASEKFTLNRGQFLYAKGNVTGVRLAVMSTMVPEAG